MNVLNGIEAIAILHKNQNVIGSNGRVLSAIEQYYEIAT